MMNISLKKHYPSTDSSFFMDIRLSIEKGEFVSLRGPSGSGKTTLLRMIAGLEEPDSGCILNNGEIWYDSNKKQKMPTMKRNIGFVFQDYALFPNMTIYQNIAYGNKNKNKIDYWIQNFHLGGLENRRPDRLSGGQKQRAAIARAFASERELLLLDEPLSALDQNLRACLRTKIRDLCRLENHTVIMVSHDLADSYLLSSRVIGINNGNVEMNISPDKLFNTGDSSRKLSFNAEVLKIIESDVLIVLQLSIDNTAGEVVVTRSDADGLKVGDRIRISAKAFNPIITKLNHG
jgi:molybdate transport system ATP-binding protein